MPNRSQRDAAIVAAWYGSGSEAEVAQRFELSNHTIQLMWVNARRAGLIPRGVKRMSSSWRLVARLDLQRANVPIYLSSSKSNFPRAHPDRYSPRPHALDGECGAPSVGACDHLLVRLQKVHPDRRYEDVVHRA